MVNVDTVYQRVLALANKEQRGYITPQEFNLFANQAQMDIFEQYFYDLNQFSRAPGNSTGHADMVELIEEKINLFEKEVVVDVTTIVNNYGQDSEVFNVDAAASDLYRISQVRVYNQGAWRVVEKVTKKQLRLMKGGPLTTPGKNRPVYTLQGKHNVIDFFNTASAITVDYIARPLKVNWTYVVVGEKPLVNVNAADYQSFELHPSLDAEAFMTALKLIKQSMSLAGVESTILSPAKTSHALLSAEERSRQGIADGLLRFSVGIEEKKDIIADFKQAFQRVAAQQLELS